MDAPAALVQATFPEPVLEVLRRLAGAGHRSWLVGGAVRDLLLHLPREAVDFDVATPATPREVMALFRRVIPTGISGNPMSQHYDDQIPLWLANEYRPFRLDRASVEADASHRLRLVPRPQR